MSAIAENHAVKRYFVKLAYKGSAYHGWQIQPNAISVQQLLEESLSRILSKKIAVSGAGRTDAGVHASEFFAHIDIPQPLNISVNKLSHAWNAVLPEDIAIYEIRAVKPDAHARFSAISRSYRYQIVRNKEPFHRDYAYYFYGPLDVASMNAAAKILLEYRDFTSFSRLHTDVKTNNCLISTACWEEHAAMLTFKITADRFLRNMVRAITGSLIDVGRGRSSIEGFRSVIEARDRSAAGFSVPAQGLFLEGITYPDDIWL